MDEMKLVALYCYLCECHDKTLRWQIQRFSNNTEPGFNDVEVLTIYLLFPSLVFSPTTRQVPQGM